MAMFAESRNALILGGNFAAVEKGDVHFHMGTIPGQRGWDLLQKNIAPGVFHDAAERPDPPRCHPRTRQSILKKIMTWIKDLDTQQLVLWLYGPAGSGKTAIAQTIAEMCAISGILAASFFFSRLAAGRSDKTHLFSTMAFELSIMIPEMRRHVESAVERDPSIFSRSLATQMQKLIVGPLNAAAEETPCREPKTPSPRLVILDGLDECTDSQAQREILETLSKCVTQLSYPLVFLVASRPEYEIREVFNTSVLRSLTWAIALDNTYHPDDDIKIFLQSKFDENKEKHPSRGSLPTPWPTDEDMDHLVKKASGQFIYASTVMKYIESHRHHPMKRLKIVLGLSNPGNDTPFAQLDALYHHIFQSVEGIEKALEILVLLILGSEYQPLLTVSFTEVLLEYEAGDVQTILSDMHALVRVPKTGDKDQDLQIYHASLSDFLLDQSRSGRFFIDSEEAHTYLAIRWINYTIVLETELRNDYGPHRLALRHCVRTKLSPTLLEALKRLDIAGYTSFFWRIHHHRYLADLSRFIEWLGAEGPCNSGNERLLFYRASFDTWFRGELMKFPPETRSYAPALFIFAGGFHEHFLAMWEILISKADLQERIQHPVECGWFWHHFNSLRDYPDLGDHAFKLVHGFFSDPSRAGEFYVDDVKYADLAEKFATFVYRPHHFDAIKKTTTKVWESIVDRTTVAWDEKPKVREKEKLNWIGECTEVALENLPIILQRAEKRPKLARYLSDKSLQCSRSDILYERRKEAGISILKYIKECMIQFRDHVHLPECDFCAICSEEQGDHAALRYPSADDMWDVVDSTPSGAEDHVEMTDVSPTNLAASTSSPATVAGLTVPVAGLNIQLSQEVICKTPSSRRSIRKRIRNWVKRGGKP
ncbi:hypothetical protein M413DRAFT_191679 [Hebeloma cylindrosporum]|uniref:Nephrocystin 3-like N-terminal domain-containing protein n=1 Tax=Hebeloma cylindrosporum TaxID=76867 RepID=A0A0C3BRY7_HEBCY|nr:hypothetical protein M413DRAFT_191679 [Hebeloma cylindrosporum h7]